MPLKGIVCTKTQMLFGVDNQMSSSLRQRYLQGFEGGDLKPARARMCEAYVNGVDGEPVDNLELCRIGGYRPKNADSARGIVWKMFVGLGKDGKLAKEYAKEREYVEFLQAKRAEESEWSAEEIERRLRRNVMENAGEIPVLRTLVANYKGGITIREALVREFNPAVVNQALHLLGKQRGMFKDQVEFRDKTVEDILEEIDGGSTGIPDKSTSQADA